MSNTPDLDKQAAGGLRKHQPDATKQLTADEVLEFSESHPEEWRNEVARDLNLLSRVGLAWLKDGEVEPSLEYAAAVQRIVCRVAEFEKIESKGKPNV